MTPILSIEGLSKHYGPKISPGFTEKVTLSSAITGP